MWINADKLDLEWFRIFASDYLKSKRFHPGTKDGKKLSDNEVRKDLAIDAAKAADEVVKAYLGQVKEREARQAEIDKRDRGGTREWTYQVPLSKPKNFPTNG